MRLKNDILVKGLVIGVLALIANSIYLMIAFNNISEELDNVRHDINELKYTVAGNEEVIEDLEDKSYYNEVNQEEIESNLEDLNQELDDTKERVDDLEED